MPWLRLWTDTLDSVKLAELDSDADRWGWVQILLAAKKYERDGVLPPLKVIAHWTRREPATVARWIEVLLGAGLLDRDGETLTVHDWDYWQPPKDRTNAERQRRYRQQQAEKRGVTALRPENDRNEPRNLSPGPLSEERNTESEREQNTLRARYVTLCTRNHNGVTAELPPEGVRSGEDLGDWREARNLLADSLQTVEVAAEMDRNGDLAGIKALEGWRWLYAARRMSGGNTPKTFAWLRKTAQMCTAEEFAEQSNPSKTGRPKVGGDVPYKPTPVKGSTAKQESPEERAERLAGLERWKAEQAELLGKIGKKARTAS